ncbi:Bromo domain-containing protein [Pleurotus pulmonarius]
MDYDSRTPNSTYSFSSPLAGPSKPTGSGLKLILPPLKGGKIVKTSKKNRKGQDAFNHAEEKAPPRPLKLKPLKEVLTKLISQIKKKDDYAFFLQPVDVSKVPGYLEMISHPMDLGTISTKVQKGRYRSLDDFSADIKLVTSNAMRFNPPGTIYHTEAQRIESWALEHIEKATHLVLQHETDWNLDGDNDDDSQQVNVDEDDDAVTHTNPVTPMDVDEISRVGRSPSVASQLPASLTRRSLRAPTVVKKSTSSTPVISESLDADGRLPGSKDGLGAFPPGSDWAETMLMLKLKGKKYKTKKERLRVEKEGPPYAADGSLDYSQMEDPFTVLSALVPDLPSRPLLTPLFPPIPNQINSQASAYPAPTALSFDYTDNLDVADQSTLKFKHWHITRSAQARNRLKEKDDADDGAGDGPAWQTPREPHTLDFGSLAILSSELSNELAKRGSGTSDPRPEEAIVLDEVRNALVSHSTTLTEPSPLAPVPDARAHNYWMDGRMREAEEYLWHLVYGGADGLAYVNSLAEFATPTKVLADSTPRSQIDGGTSDTEERKSSLGMPLADWVIQNIVDPLTGGHHTLLRQTALQLQKLMAGGDAPVVNMETDSDAEFNNARSVADQVALSVYTYPLADQALSTLRRIYSGEIDMGCLIRHPSEFTLSEEEWIGKSIKAQSRRQEGGSNVVEEHLELEGPDLLNQAFNYSAELIAQIDQEIRTGRRPALARLDSMKTDNDIVMKTEGKAARDGTKTELTTSTDTPPPSPSEDPVLRNLRLNLLALTKRAPVATIAPLPKDLVPKDVQDVVPTLPS